MEAVTAGVPMYVHHFLNTFYRPPEMSLRIFWPFGADQPLTAVHVTDNLHAGYELIETRSGPDGLKPIYRNGRQPRGTVEALKEEVREVLQKAFDGDGEEKRNNLLKITSAVQREWDDGGVARRDMAAFLSGI